MQCPQLHANPTATEGQEGLLLCKKLHTCHEGSLTKSRQPGATKTGRMESKPSATESCKTADSQRGKSPDGVPMPLGTTHHTHQPGHEPSSSAAGSLHNLL